MEDENVFPGFIFPAPKGHTQIPNTWYDEIVSQIDNVAELKVVLYILRHTCGFQRAEEAQYLTVDEIMHGRLFNGVRFDRGTGLSEMSVRNGLKKAEEHGYIVSGTDTSNKARIGKCYKLRFSEVQNLDLKQEAEVQNLGIGGTNIRPPEVQNLESKGTDFRPQSPGREKEKKEREKERMKDVSSIHSFILSSDCLEKIKDFAEKYGDDNHDIYQEMVRRLYQRYAISDDDFYNYLIEAYRASSKSKSKSMPDFLEKLQRMLEANFGKR